MIDEILYWFDGDPVYMSDVYPYDSYIGFRKPDGAIVIY